CGKLDRKRQWCCRLAYRSNTTADEERFPKHCRRVCRESHPSISAGHLAESNFGGRTIASRSCELAPSDPLWAIPLLAGSATQTDRPLASRSDGRRGSTSLE